jgi:membrane protease subunit (stomatin/prohibitin family)
MVTNFIRSLSQRLTKSKNRQQQHHQPRKQQTAELVGQQHCRHCQCRIQLLDQTDLNFVIEVRYNKFAIIF